MGNAIKKNIILGSIIPGVYVQSAVSRPAPDLISLALANPVIAVTGGVANQVIAGILIGGGIGYYLSENKKA